MSNNTVISEKKKALLAYKEKILEEIKYCESSIADLRANQTNNRFYDDHENSSDSEDDLPHAIDMGPTIAQLKLKQAVMKTCLHATLELTNLIVLESEITVLVEDPKLEGERPVIEAGTWREVTAECSIDHVPFTITYLMHVPSRKFAQPSYRGLRVVPVKNVHEIELAQSVLHSVKLPSDAVEVLKSYAAAFRSRRTTLLRLCDKYAHSLNMEPHPEGGFMLKCADLLEMSWRLENERSPVAPFQHKMKFALEYMDESYIKIISQAHKQLSDPAIQCDERTLLLATIIDTCLEVRGPIDSESDLESKTTIAERDNDIENEKRDSEVMAPPKSPPKKVKQKSSVPIAKKRAMDDGNDDISAKKLKLPDDGAKKSIVGNTAKKSKINEAVNEGGKKRKLNDVSHKNTDKVASSKNVKENANHIDNNPKNVKETKKTENKIDKTNPKSKNVKDSANTEDKDGNAKPKNQQANIDDKNGKVKSKNQQPKDSGNVGQDKTNANSKNLNAKEVGNQNNIDNDDNVVSNNKNNKKVDKPSNTENKDGNIKTKIVKQTGNIEDNTKSKTKIMEDTGITEDKRAENSGKEIGNMKPKNKIIKKPSNIEPVKIIKPKNITKEAGNPDNNINENENNAKTTTIEKNKPTNVESVKMIKPKNMTKEAGNPDDNHLNENENNAKTTTIKKNKPINVEPVKIIKPKNVTKEAGNPDDNNINENEKNTKKNKPKNVASTKSKENINGNKITEKVTANDVERPKSSTIEKKRNIANTKTLQNNPVKTLIKPKTATDLKTKETVVANTKNDDQETRKALEKDKNNQKLPEITNKGSLKTVKDKPVNLNVKNDHTDKKVTEKNATNFKIKDKISQINNKDENDVKDKHTSNMKEIVSQKVFNSNLDTKKSKEMTKTKKITEPIITMKNITTKISSHRDSVKVINPQKKVLTGNTKILNTEKENGGISKIPQKKLSAVRESSIKKNLLRISPRQASKFKTLSQNTLKQKLLKTTNIPRLMSAPKTTK